MVQLPSSAKIRPDPVRPAAEAAAADRVAVKVEVEVEVEDPLEDEHGPFNKRSKHLAPPQQEMYNNVPDEPSRWVTAPKEPVAAGFDPDEAHASEFRCGFSRHIDRLKASNFPATLLRIGLGSKWILFRYVSRYEGDLVAKCYFAKHKLVWEVLEGGLKSKIEIQWSRYYVSESILF
ncbi:hypothetical protein ACMD2_11155 [Ananas comosus]|uniref:TRF2/HOY1 PH-like domain-containing protein n=1 Tax=Ananas comosus TaxID=4615 RepID=A0A199V4G0_ANACO|nr:hypothetical protein ACMD2_11155 [Ananas comosus]